MQIRVFLLKRRKYIRRHKDSEVKIPTIDKLMEEEDLEQLSRAAVARFKSLDKLAHPEEYRQRDREDEESSDESDDSDEEGDESSDEDDRARGATNLREALEGEGGEHSDVSSERHTLTAGKLIKNRLRVFEKQVYTEENIIATLRWMYGPKSMVEADNILKACKMNKNVAPYRSLQYSTEYSTKFEETLQWIHDFKPDSKTIRETFIKGVYPPELQQELTLLKIKKLDRLIETFHETYYDNFESLRELETKGVVKFAQSVAASAKPNADIGHAGATAKKKFVQWTAAGTTATASSSSSGAGAAGGGFKPAGEATKKASEGESPRKAREHSGPKRCFICNSEKHLAYDCPERKESTPTKAAAAASPRQSRSFMRAGTVEPRACLACHMGAPDADAPTLLVRVNMDTMADDNLVPEQWLVVLRGEGVEPVPLEVPIHVTWGIKGAEEVILRAYVDIAVRVIAWAGREAATTARFYVIQGDGDALTMGYRTMDKLGITDHLSSLVKAQTALGLTLTCPSPQADPPVQDMDGRAVSLSELESEESERERLVEEAKQATAQRDADFVDPASVPKDALFIGRHSLEYLRPELMASGVFQPELERGGASTAAPMEIHLREGFSVPLAKGGRRYAPRVQAALEEEVARQLRLGVIEECDDPPAQEVVMVRKDDAASGFRFTLDARAVNAGMVIEPCNPPPIPEVLRGLAGCKFLARLDLASAYWQFGVAEQYRPLSAFRVGQRVYRYCVVWMGGAGASHFVQRTLSNLLRKHLGNGV